MMDPLVFLRFGAGGFMSGIMKPSLVLVSISARPSSLALFSLPCFESSTCCSRFIAAAILAFRDPRGGFFAVAAMPGMSEKE